MTPQATPARFFHCNAVVNEALRGVKVQYPHQPSSLKGDDFVPIVLSTDKCTTRCEELRREAEGERERGREREGEGERWV